MVIMDFLEKNAKLYPNDVALVEINPQAMPKDWKEYSLIESSPGARYRRTITWRDFDLKANQFANFLFTRGVKKGDKVGILLMNCIEWLPIYFGVLKTGALAVPMNYRYAAEEIAYCVDLADVSYLVFGPEFTERITSVLDRLPTVKNFYFVGENVPDFADDCMRLIEYCSPVAPAVDLNEDDDAAIYFSSGTTGFPKAILHAHRSILNSCRTEQNHHSQKKEDVFLCIPPLYHTGAKMHWFGSLMMGGKTVLLKGVRPDWIMQTISDENVSIVWLLVPWVQDILDSIERGDVRLEDYKLNQLRLMHVGAQPVPPSLIHRWLKVFPNHQYDTNYGLSESIGPGCVHLGVENVDKVGAIGKAGYLWETKVVDDAGNEIRPGSGDVGELLVKGPGVMKCYYKNPKATEEVLKDGWLYTGDMAEVDKDGFIYLVDRKKDVIISGGENLYPVEIENFIRKFDKVKDVAVIGLPDHRLGEIAGAIIELKPDCEATEEEINAFCEGMPRYKRPKKIIFAPVPRNPTGKIEKPKLREKYCGKRLVEQQITG